VTVAAALTGAATVPVAAQTDPAPEEVQRDRAENRRPAVSSELNELQASDEQL
jgi:hypothetical protein